MNLLNFSLKKGTRIASSSRINAIVELVAAISLQSSTC
jgi:hypothetical protein